MRRAAFLVLLTLTALSTTRLASAAEVYNETTSGDLSGDGLNPTQLSVSLGSNTLTATSVAGDREYYRFTVPAGQQLNALVVVSTSATRSFVGMQQGPQVTVSPTSGSPAGLLGWSHFGSLEAGTASADILPRMAASFTPPLFSPPLPAGTYAFWSQETSGTPATYTFDFQIAAVPPAPRAPVPPAFTGVLALGLLGLGMWRVKRRSHAAA